ncbi:hypothetical protein CsSME_00005767 [Camellia sinensis var. sinensis]
MAEIILALVVGLALSQTTSHGAAAAAAAPPPPPPNTTVDFLEPHNQARAEVGVEPLKWSEKLANGTSLLVRYQRNKMGCNFANLTGSKYGGNQLWASASAGVTPREAVEAWVAEKKYYDYGNNSCTAAEHKCGVYTQVVWRKTVEVGCAQARCVKEDASLTVCFYNPPGNVIGESPY